MDKGTRIRVGLNTPVKSDGTSWYRGCGPFGHMELTYDDFDYISMTTGEWDWATARRCSVIVIQRPWTPTDAGIAGMAQRMGIPVIADWDDDLACLSESNPSYLNYTQPGNIQAINDLPKMIDQAWVSTPYLKKVIDKRAGKEISVVIPNAFDDQACGMRNPGTTHRIMWRGGSSHVADCDMYAEAMQRVIAQHVKWTFVGIGDVYWKLRIGLPKERMVLIGWQDAPLFMRQTLEINPEVAIVPLEDTEFNRSKSNIAWLEGVAAGAVVVAPDWDVWQVPAVYHYKAGDVASFQAACTKAMKTPREERHKQVAEAQCYIKQKLSLSVVNEQRYKQLKGIV